MWVIPFSRQILSKRTSESLRPNLPVKTLPLSVRISSGTPQRVRAATKCSQTGLAVARAITTWTMQVTGAGKIYDVVFVGGTAINPGVRLVDHPTYPGIAEDFKRTFQTLRSLKCDVFLGAHGGYYGMIEKYKRLEGLERPL